MIAPIRFDDDAIDTFITVLDGLQGWHVDIERAEGYEGYGMNPCAILKADDEGLTISEVADDDDPHPGAPTNSTWLLPYEGILSITIL